MIPPFRADGALPEGLHAATWDEVRNRFGGSERRENLLDGIHRALIALAEAVCQRFYLDGSFVTSKREPADWDGCYDDTACAEDVLTLAFYMDVSEFPRFQKRRYGGELYPALWEALGQGMTFLDLFQMRHERRPTGIVMIDPRSAL